jgi:hypothetical protein
VSRSRAVSTFEPGRPVGSPTEWGLLLSSKAKRFYSCGNRRLKRRREPGPWAVSAKIQLVVLYELNTVNECCRVLCDVSPLPCGLRGVVREKKRGAVWLPFFQAGLA